MSDLSIEQMAELLQKRAAQSIFHAPKEEQLTYVMDLLQKAGTQGVRVSELPQEGAVEAQKRGLAQADVGRLYITSQGKKFGSEDKEGASTIQSVVLEYMGNMHKGQDVTLNDMATHPSFRGIHLSRIERAAEGLAKKGIIKFDGVHLTKMASRIRSSWKEGAGGLYGYTKQTQADCESAIRRVAKQTAAVARSLYAKDPKVARFLNTHANRAGSMSAKLLVAAMGEMGPKFASGKEARGERGLYGYPRKTAHLGLTACADLRDFTGSVAYALHSRRAARYEKITGFFDRHASEGGCNYSRYLLSSYPDMEVLKAAGLDKEASIPDDWLSWDEG
jgi:hypothetical protein